jgi:hypothetical protein
MAVSPANWGRVRAVISRKLGISQLRNFPFWEILAETVGSGNSFHKKMLALFFMTKSRHSARYARLLKVLRETRLNAGLTQQQVGKKFGGHASFVSKIESGERRLDVVELAEFCQLYGIKLSAFLQQAGLE